MAATTRLDFTVTGMHCASCGIVVDESVEELGGVSSSRTDSRGGRAVVEADLSRVTIDAIVGAIAGAGYGAELMDR